MLFIVHCLDHKDARTRRKEHYEAHRAYVSSAPLKRIAVIMNGPLVHENNESAGSLFLVEAPDLDTVKAFIADDPFSTNNVFETVNIHAFLRRAP